MGSLVSKARLFLEANRQLQQSYRIVLDRVEASPGLPVPDPTASFWADPPARLPDSADTPLVKNTDLVIIGSGITGTSFAYYALAQRPSLNVLMLEARDVCSGATARNGGHINPPLYHDYGELKAEFGQAAAEQMIRFRLAHATEFCRIADAENILKHSQCRTTEHIEVYMHPETFNPAKERLLQFQREMPEEAHGSGSLEKEEAIKKFRLSEEIAGCIYNVGGAVHPYRFVTSLLRKLLDRHPGNFSIATHTPCTSINAPTAASPHYTVLTPRGAVTTTHVVHATNGWCSHLLAPLRAKIIPACGMMSAQRPGSALSASSADGARSWAFFTSRGAGAEAGYDYLTQLPAGEHELMFGSGWAQTFDRSVPPLGVADDSKTSPAVAAHLAGALPLYFGAGHWGTEALPPPLPTGGPWGAGRTKAQWSGILGISVDGMPWVGRLPEKVSGRAAPPSAAVTQAEKDGATLAAPGEWIAAGYTGEGMVHAWLSGKALAYMVLDQEDALSSWFPEALRVSEKRLNETNLDTLIERYM